MMPSFTDGHTAGSWERWDGQGWIDVAPGTPVSRTTHDDDDDDPFYEILADGEWWQARPGATGHFSLEPIRARRTR